LSIENERLQSTIQSLQTEKDLVINQLKTEVKIKLTQNDGDFFELCLLIIFFSFKKTRADRLEKAISEMRTNQQKSLKQYVNKHN
jgi:hypothetical protein